jgi:hypothetical protein
MSNFISSNPMVNHRPDGGMGIISDFGPLMNGVLTKVELRETLPSFEDGIEDTVNYRILPGVEGLFLCIAQCTFIDVVADKDYAVVIKRNSAMGCRVWGHSTSIEDLTLTAVTAMWIGPTKYFEMFAISNSGNNLVELDSGDYKTFLQVLRLR